MWRFIYLVFLSHCFQTCQNHTPNENGSKLILHTNPSVKNAKEINEKELIETWQSYLTSSTHYLPDNPFWSSARSKVADAFLWPLALHKRSKKGQKIQNSVIGVFPVEHDHYAIKSVFSTTNDTTGQIILNYIVTVYAAKIEGQFRLVNSTDYHRLIWQSSSIGNITYYIHPEHDFDSLAAMKMDSFNTALAKQFDTAPLTFDYFVANYSRDILALMGYDFMPRSFQPMQSGGMAANYDNVIYAGNNSAYYPHEVVHLYTYARFNNQYHSWVDEGIATFFGGSAGHPLDWHLQKLSIFLNENPMYPLTNLQKLQVDIPNGEYTTEFRYAIGGLICRLIYEQEGMLGIFEALTAGQNDADYFRLVKEKLGINKNEFGDFVRAQLESYRADEIKQDVK